MEKAQCACKPDDVGCQELDVLPPLMPVRPWKLSMLGLFWPKSKVEIKAVQPICGRTDACHDQADMGDPVN